MSGVGSFSDSSRRPISEASSLGGFSSQSTQAQLSRLSITGMAPGIDETDYSNIPILKLANTKPPRLPEGTLQDFSPQLFRPVSYSENRKCRDSSAMEDLSLEYLQAEVEKSPDASGH